MNEWVEKIEKYFISTSEYPLMLVVPSTEYREVLSNFSSTPKIKVSDYCVGADKDPDIEKLKNDINHIEGNFILLGLGDYLANKSEIAKSTILSYKDLILRKKSHVAIILTVQMYQIIKELNDTSPRYRTRIVLPKTQKINDDFNSKNIVYGIREYLQACENGESVGRIKTARDIQLTNVINIENSFDELAHKFPNEFKKLSPNFGSADYWSKLLEDLNESKSNISKYLATQNFSSPEHIFLDYAKKRDYKSWLYFLHIKINENPKSYIGLVACKASGQNDLFKIAKTEILNFSISDKAWSSYYEQRKTMLKNCTDTDMADFILKIAVKGNDRIAYLTDNTKVEKQAVIVALCEGASDENLSVAYPDLYRYRQDFLFEEKCFTDYFSLYKKCKMTNTVSQEFMSVVEKYSVNRPYNSLPARSSLISNVDDGKTYLIFLDALGVEYLGYIKEICEELEIRFLTRIARAELPTITSINRKFFDEWKGKKETPIKALDDLKHHPEKGYDYNNSSYPIHLAEELEIIKIALERAKIKLLTGEFSKILIVSDHGASRLAVIFPDVQVSSNGCDVKSSGRYCTGADLPVATNIVAEAEGGYAVMSNYARFTGSRVASVEVHGGATLEEVLIPIIEITLPTDIVEVRLESCVVENIRRKTQPLVVFIIPDSENITASVEQHNCLVEKIEKNKYKIVLPDLKNGKHTISVFESQNKIVNIEFTVKSKGFAERDMF